MAVQHGCRRFQPHGVATDNDEKEYWQDEMGGDKMDSRSWRQYQDTMLDIVKVSSLLLLLLLLLLPILLLLLPLLLLLLLVLLPLRCCCRCCYSTKP